MVNAFQNPSNEGDTPKKGGVLDAPTVGWVSMSGAVSVQLGLLRYHLGKKLRFTFHFCFLLVCAGCTKKCTTLKVNFGATNIAVSKALLCPNLRDTYNYLVPIL